MDKKETLERILEDANTLIKTAKNGRQNIKTITNPYGKKVISLESKANKILKELERKTAGTTSDEIKSSLKTIKENLDMFFDSKTTKKTRNSSFTKILIEYSSNIEPNLNKSYDHTPSDDLFPLELVEGTKSYILKTAKQACGCYDLGYFDASAVMTRKLLETLIIECFETYKISSKIKDKVGNFFYFSDLITKFLDEDGQSWNIGRNTKSGLPKLKSIGDKSAHNRRFTARKKDLEDLQENLRTTIEELVYISKK